MAIIIVPGRNMGGTSKTCFGSPIVSFDGHHCVIDSSSMFQTHVGNFKTSRLLCCFTNVLYLTATISDAKTCGLDQKLRLRELHLQRTINFPLCETTWQERGKIATTTHTTGEDPPTPISPAEDSLVEAYRIARAQYHASGSLKCNGKISTD